VIGTDSNGCSDSADITVTINPLPTVNAGVDQTECEGTAITLSASGANSYIWDNAVINNTSFNPPLGATVYSVVGTDVNGCENSDDVQVIMNPNPILIVSSNELFCLGDSITLSASGAITYSWDGGTFSGSDYPVLPLNSVSIDVVGTSSFGCTSQEIIDLSLDDPELISAGPDQLVKDLLQI
jgi:hypothetical protein